jgi:hypothetical protein
MQKQNNGDKKNAMLSLLEEEDKGVHQTSHVLGRLWRIVLKNENLSGFQWNRYITRYQERINRFTSKRGVMNMKGNLTRRLAEPKLSWGSIMRGFAILEYTKIEIIFRFHKNKQHFDVHMTINNDEINQQTQEDEE